MDNKWIASPTLRFVVLVLLFATFSAASFCQEETELIESGARRSAMNSMRSTSDFETRLRHSRIVLRECYPQYGRAIRNGVSLVRLLAETEHHHRTDLSATWRRRRVAFYCLHNPPDLTVEASIANTAPVRVVVRFVSPHARPRPIVVHSCILGVVTAIDVRTRTVFITAQEKQWFIRSTG